MLYLMQYRYEGSIIVYNAKHRKYGLHIIYFRRNPTKKLSIHRPQTRINGCWNEISQYHRHYNNIITIFLLLLSFSNTSHIAISSVDDIIIIYSCIARRHPGKINNNDYKICIIGCIMVIEYIYSSRTSGWCQCVTSHLSEIMDNPTSVNWIQHLVYLPA